MEDKIPKNALESCDEGPIGPNAGQTVDSIGATDVHHPVHIQIVNTDLQELNNDDLREASIRTKTIKETMKHLFWEFLECLDNMNAKTFFVTKILLL